jgi:hypothetical protein
VLTGVLSCCCGGLLAEQESYGFQLVRCQVRSTP